MCCQAQAHVYEALKQLLLQLRITVCLCSYGPLIAWLCMCALLVAFLGLTALLRLCTPWLSDQACAACDPWLPEQACTARRPV